MKTGSNFIRGILTLIAIFATSVAMFAQTTMTKHIVARGETLQDIAARYGTTTENIINSNPQAAQFIYVGMELEIPITPAATTMQPEAVVQQPATIVSPQEIRAERQSSNVLLSTVETPQQSAQSIYSSAPASRFGILGFGYFKSDVFKYGANINMEGVCMINHEFGYDISFGGSVVWNPKFDIANAFVFTLGPLWGTNVSKDVDFYFPIKFLGVYAEYKDPNSGKNKGKFECGCRINPFICISSLTIGVYADIAKTTEFGLSFGFLFPN